MTDRKEINMLVDKMNSLGTYTWVNLDREDRIESVGCELWSTTLDPLSAAERLRELV